MAKMRTNMPPEAEEARLLFSEVGRLRREGKAEALRALEARISEQSNHLKSLIARMLASGIEIHEIIKSTGISRQTITNYKNDYLKLMNLDSLESVVGGVTHVEAVEEVMLPDGVRVTTEMKQINREGDQAASHTFSNSKGLIGTLESYRGEDSLWYDNLKTGVFGPDAPEYALAYEKKWLAENA